MDIPKRSETGLKPSETVGKQLYPLIVPKRSETGLKPSETVGKQLYPLILHLYGNLWTSRGGPETGLKPSETVGKQPGPPILHLYGNLWTSQRGSSLVQGARVAKKVFMQHFTRGPVA